MKKKLALLGLFIASAACTVGWLYVYTGDMDPLHAPYLYCGTVVTLYWWLQT